MFKFSDMVWCVYKIVNFTSVGWALFLSSGNKSNLPSFPGCFFTSPRCLRNSPTHPPVSCPGTRWRPESSAGVSLHLQNTQFGSGSREPRRKQPLQCLLFLTCQVLPSLQGCLHVPPVSKSPPNWSNPHTFLSLISCIIISLYQT